MTAFEDFLTNAEKALDNLQAKRLEAERGITDYAKRQSDTFLLQSGTEGKIKTPGRNGDSHSRVGGALGCGNDQDRRICGLDQTADGKFHPSVGSNHDGSCGPEGSHCGTEHGCDRPEDLLQETPGDPCGARLGVREGEGKPPDVSHPCDGDHHDDGACRDVRMERVEIPGDLPPAGCPSAILSGETDSRSDGVLMFFRLVAIGLAVMAFGTAAGGILQVTLSWLGVK